MKNTSNVLVDENDDNSAKEGVGNGNTTRKPMKKRPLSSPQLQQDFINEFWRVNEVLHDHSNQLMSTSNFTAVKLPQHSTAPHIKVSDSDSSRKKRKKKSSEINTDKKDDTGLSVSAATNIQQEIDEYAKGLDHYPDLINKHFYSLADYIKDNSDHIEANSGHIFPKELRNIHEGEIRANGPRKKKK